MKSDTTLDDGTVVNGWWAQIDLGVQVVLTNYRIYAKSNSVYVGGVTTNTYASPQNAIVLTSLTGEDGTWTQVHEIIDRDDTFGWFDYNILLSNQIVGQFYRLVITNNQGNSNWATVGEWSLMGITTDAYHIQYQKAGNYITTNTITITPTNDNGDTINKMASLIRNKLVDSIGSTHEILGSDDEVIIEIKAHEVDINIRINDDTQGTNFLSITSAIDSKSVSTANFTPNYEGNENGFSISNLDRYIPGVFSITIGQYDTKMFSIGVGGITTATALATEVSNIFNDMTNIISTANNDEVTIHVVDHTEQTITAPEQLLVLLHTNTDADIDEIVLYIIQGSLQPVDLENSASQILFNLTQKQTRPYDYPDLKDHFTVTELYNNELMLEIDSDRILIDENGNTQPKSFTPYEMYLVGYSPREVLTTPYDYTNLYNIFDPVALYNDAETFTVSEMKQIGYTARQTITAYDYQDLYNIYTPTELYDNEIQLNESITIPLLQHDIEDGDDTITIVIREDTSATIVEGSYIVKINGEITGSPITLTSGTLEYSLLNLFTTELIKSSLVNNGITTLGYFIVPNIAIYNINTLRSGQDSTKNHTSIYYDANAALDNGERWLTTMDIDGGMTERGTSSDNTMVNGTNINGPWVEISFAEEMMLSNFQIYYGSYWRPRVKDATLLAWNDNQWVVIYTIENRNDNNSSWETYQINSINYIPATKYRLVITDVYDDTSGTKYYWPHVEIQKLRFYGTKESEWGEGNTSRISRVGNDVFNITLEYPQYTPLRGNYDSNIEVLTPATNLDFIDEKFVLNWTSIRDTYDSNKNYGLTFGTYIIQNIPPHRPLAVVSENEEIAYLITYTGDNDKKTNESGVDFYYGSLTINVQGNFDEASLYSYVGGFLGGKGILKYIDHITQLLL